MQTIDFTVSALLELGVTDFHLMGTPTTEEEFLASFRKITGEDEEGRAIESDDPSTFGVTWVELEAKINELKDAEPLKLLREARNQKLAETDWIVVVSLESGTAIPSEWQTYRQSLRDITETYTSLDDVVWPERPQV